MNERLIVETNNPPSEGKEGEEKTAVVMRMKKKRMKVIEFMFFRICDV